MNREETKTLQAFLNANGQNVGRIDGHLGPKTTRALQAFLTSNGFPEVGTVDGVWGSKTARAYSAAKAKGLFSGTQKAPAAVAPAAVARPSSAHGWDYGFAARHRPVNGKPMINSAELLSDSVGHGGANRPDDVKKVQKLLAVEPDGVVGPVTRRGIRDYQKSSGLRVTGRFEQGPIPERASRSARSGQTSGRSTQPDRVAMPEGTKFIYVDLGSQMLVAFQGPEITHCFPCVTGAKSSPTKPGQGKIYRKQKIYRSVKYKAQMNYALFFRTYGEAIHASYVPEDLEFLGLSVREWVPNKIAQRARRYARTLLGQDEGVFGSRGCVGLAEEDAIELFDWTPFHMRVELGVVPWEQFAQRHTAAQAATRVATTGALSEPPAVSRRETTFTGRW